MNVGLDTGDILKSEEIKISSQMNFIDLEKKLSILGGKLLIETIRDFSIGSLKQKRQPKDGITYAEKVRKNEGKIDWTSSASDIEKKVKALNPWPGVWFENEVNHRKTIIKVHSVEIIEENFGKKAGTVLDEKLTIACGSSALRILTLQRSGRKIMTVEEYLRGSPVPVGSQFC